MFRQKNQLNYQNRVRRDETAIANLWEFNQLEDLDVAVVY